MVRNVIYYQFKFEEPGDYRILWDGNLTIYTLKGISFHINTHYRFDKRGENYFEFSKSELNLSKFSTKTTTFPKLQEVPTYDMLSCIVELKNYKNNLIIKIF